MKISRWALVVPLHDSIQVNKHLTKKSDEVRLCGLSFVADDFEAIIHDLESFDQANVMARAIQRRSVVIGGQPPSEQEIVNWTGASNTLVATLTEKMRSERAT